MRILLAFFLLLSGPALADKVCPTPIFMEPGTIVQYKNSTGGIHAGILLTLNIPTFKWDLVSFGSTGLIQFHTAVPNDQTQNQNNSFAVISCQVPF